MRTISSILFFTIISLAFLACNSNDQQNGTDQNAPNTLESLINQNANSTATTTTTLSTGSMGVNDIWVLAGVNSKEKYNVNLVNNTPMLDLDTAKSSFTGHTGCNSLKGKMKILGNKLVFSNVALTSDQPCIDQGFEKKLLSSFKSGPLAYKIANDTMALNGGGGTEFFFRRIRRN